VSSFAVTGIGVLATCDPDAAGHGPLGLVENATLVVEDAQVVYAGPAASAPQGAETSHDVGGRCLVPGFVDSHTHLIFAGDRAAEFAARMAGQPYRPGGINDTVAATRAAPAEDLRARAAGLVRAGLQAGITTVEIKTGYGLTLDTELLHIGIAADLTDEPTLLAAHLVPPEFEHDRAGYLRLVIDSIIPAAGPAGARWCDVFCETGAFDADESRAVLEAAAAHGLGLKVHANQLRPGPGVALACELGAASADHCTHLTPADIDALASSDTVATLLPMSDFCTRQPFPDGRGLVDAGATVALATNCNPGSSYSLAMPVALALAVRECGLTVDEAVLAATRGGAAALRRTDLGRLSPGSRADAVVIDAPDPTHLVYRLGTPLVHAVLKAGRWVSLDPR
jgi:imidazolonepropionase